MNNLKVFKIYPISLIALIAYFFAMVPGVSVASEYDVSGVIESTNNHDIQPISETHIVLLASMDEKLVPNDPASPWQGAIGPCGGSVVIKDGTISGSGLCTFTDKDNDRFVISWKPESMNEKGGPIGVWSLIGGSGKYAKASASGNYNDMPSDNPAFSTIALTGKLNIP